MKPLLVCLLSLSSLPAQALELRQPYIREGGETEHRLHLQLDASFTFGIGGQSALGVSTHLTGYTALWNSAHATGTIDVGVQLAYGNEPIALAPWLSPDTTSGAAHRVQALATIGHTFHMGQRRRLAFGVHLFGGLNHWVSSYSVHYASEGVSGSATVQRDLFITGAEVKLAYRFSRHVGFNLLINSPFQYQSSYVQGIFFVGAGLTFYAR